MRTNKQIRERICWRVWMYQEQIDWHERCIRCGRPRRKHEQAISNWRAKQIAAIELAKDLIGDNEQIYYTYIDQRRKDQQAQATTLTHEESELPF